ncbi:flagellar biosynthesis protein [Frateuria sp. Soil773]|uniref:hypothetical protein n=1 Tax=Frateuria sp. Soil773 TaxID=1736407 RepID=UPI0006F77998|nr:hypothetical protein [Frateuria sp. Soil773]KRE90934.1 flagellar biosynthesis protein [Frateuria sp. Soil773]
MNPPLPAPQRRVTLRLAGPTDERVAAAPPEALDTLLARARALGLPLHPDPQIGAVLAALRLRDDVPATLYAAAASVLASVYDAAGEPAD